MKIHIVLIIVKFPKKFLIVILGSFSQQTCHGQAHCQQSLQGT